MVSIGRCRIRLEGAVPERAWERGGQLKPSQRVEEAPRFIFVGMVSVGQMLGRCEKASKQDMLDTHSDQPETRSRRWSVGKDGGDPA